MSGVAAAIAGAAVIGYIASEQASSRAADAQEEASKNANATQLGMYEQQRKDNEPWRQTGESALGHLAQNDFMKNWQTDPGYQFRIDQGNRAINAAASARGMANSGRALKELTEYGSNLASNEYNNAYNRQYNRLSALAGYGQGANNQNGGAATNYANAYGQNVTGAANAYGASQMASAQNTQNLANTGANMWMAYQMNGNKGAGSNYGGGGYGSAGGSNFGSNMA